MNYGINLLENKNKSKAKPASSGLRKLRWIAIGSLFFVSSASVILFLLIALSPLPQLQRQEATARQTLSQYNSEMVKLAVINERTGAISSIIASRPSYDKTIEMLKSIAPDGVVITGFDFKKGLLEVIVSSKSLTSIDTFLNTLADNTKPRGLFRSVMVSPILVDEDKQVVNVTVDIGTL